MKGPGLRLTLVVERRWSCPACGRKVITDGDVTTLACSCADPLVWMKMDDPRTNPRPVPRMPDAQTLTDEDLDRLGIEPLKETPSDDTPSGQASNEAAPDSTGLNTDHADVESSPPTDGSPGEVRTSRREELDTLPPSADLVTPSGNDDFGAGLDDD
ncbi:MAG: hypothetical protein O2955_12570 [Planctomycetota bacterium]|nr:hypothetical protein [Planctomycetota bacterium]MDA1213345.1 hypothetical protein [Planctomycetota bacterium]